MDIKKQAKLLKTEMQKVDPTYRLCDAYEALAKEAGFSSWNHYSARLKQQREASRAYRKKEKKK